jgi:hypothetical protein
MKESPAKTRKSHPPRGGRVEALKSHKTAAQIAPMFGAGES